MRDDLTYQQQFSTALLQPEVDLQALLDNANELGRERFDVHRNNVVGTWLDALRSGFPITRQLLGEEYFDAVAFEYAHQSPPTSPVLQEYGQTFAHFLVQFESLQAYPYIPDIAELEWRRRLAYHAADQDALTLTQLRALPVEQWLFKQFSWHSSTQLLLSAFPIEQIWRNQVSGTVLAAADAWQGENVLIWRPQLELKQQVLSDAQTQILLAIKDGHNLAQAIEFSGRGLSEMSRQFMQLVQLGCFALWTE